ncbi:MAG: GNAT family N-acetyltransferase [Actinobacteria bacterium]|nr:GNAT family N-acetyltransferase [Actinomycetota bacterium]
MTGSPVDPSDLVVTRVVRPGHDLLVTLEEYDLEAFGPTGLRTYDLAVMARAGAVYLASVDEEIAGSCQILRTLDESEFFYIVGFYVRPQWQGRGIGRAFLMEVATKVKELGGQGLMLTVAPENAPAIRLYRSTGFVDEAFIPDFYGDGHDRHILRWRFDEGGLHGGV